MKKLLMLLTICYCFEVQAGQIPFRSLSDLNTCDVEVTENDPEIFHLIIRADLNKISNHIDNNSIESLVSKKTESGLYPHELALLLAFVNPEDNTRCAIAKRFASYVVQKEA